MVIPLKQPSTISLRRGALAALGIVYGDLGTSPLYTMQTVVTDAGGHFGPRLGLGILSLIFWTLIITISLKYCLFVMRVDNHGEGGILALMSLVAGPGTGRMKLLIFCGLFGASLIYGDGIITPAISVLSALEGVNVATKELTPYIMPLAVLVLLALFGSQHFGTARIGRLFGPVMLIWFVVIGSFGVLGIARHPQVLEAVYPGYAIELLLSRSWTIFFILGGIFLAVTGGEALYADMGHIGRTPIRLSWFVVVLPALLLNYAGQTGEFYGSDRINGNPFFLLVPSWALYPTVGLAVLATIIASQAIITGAFSLTRQAIQLSWLPGLRIRQTSDTEYGQIYVPFINWVMMVFTILLTTAFRSSDRLAGAYGTAVSTTMLLTTVLLYSAMRKRWGWHRFSSATVSGAFLLVDLAFFGGNLLKVASGGWIPLVFGMTIFILMIIWRQGVNRLSTQIAPAAEATEELLRRVNEKAVLRAPGTGVFLSRTATPVAPLMARHVAEFGVLPTTAISLTIHFREIPRVKPDARLEIVKVLEGIWHITVRFGFLEMPDLPTVLAEAKDTGCPIELATAVYFGARDDVVPAETRRGLAVWQPLLFSYMYRNAVHTVDRFGLPSKQFVEVGRRIEI